MAKEARGFIWLECTECKSRNYRVSKKLKGSQQKLELKKYCPKDRKHTVHIEKKK